MSSKPQCGHRDNLASDFLFYPTDCRVPWTWGNCGFMRNRIEKRCKNLLTILKFIRGDQRGLRKLEMWSWLGSTRNNSTPQLAHLTIPAMTNKSCLKGMKVNLNYHQLRSFGPLNECPWQQNLLLMNYFEKVLLCGGKFKWNYINCVESSEDDIKLVSNRF